MTMTREDLDSQRVDFSDIASGRRLPSVHPGETLRQEFLTPMALGVYELANARSAAGSGRRSRLGVQPEVDRSGQS